MNKKKYGGILRTLLSGLLCFCLTLSVFAGAAPFRFDIRAAGTNDNIKVQGISSNKNAELFANVKGSIVASPPTAIGHYMENGQWKEKSVGGDFSKLADNDIESGAHYMASAFKFADKDGEGNAAKYYTDGTERYLDIIYDLGKVQSVSNVIVSHHTAGILRTGSYLLYASEQYDKLFTDSGLLYKCFNEIVQIRSQLYTFRSLRARYVALRIYNPYGTDSEKELKGNSATKVADNAYVRLFQFNVYGEEPIQIKKSVMSAGEFNNIAKSRSSLILNKQATSAYLYLSGKKYDLDETIYETVDGHRVNTAADHPGFSVLTDNGATLDDEIRAKNTTLSFVDKSKNLIDDESRQYCQLNFKLDTKSTVTGAVLYGHPTPELSPSHIRVSVAQAENELFTDKAAYTSGDLYTSDFNFSDITFTSGCRGNYFGVRIICGVSEKAAKAYTYGNLYLRMREIAVYGVYGSTFPTVEQLSLIHMGNGEKITRAGEAEISFDGVPDNNGNYSPGASVTLKAKVSLRYSGKLYSFLNWTNSSGNIVSNDAVCTLKPTKNDTYYANYGSPKKQVKFSFSDRNGNIVYSTNVPYGTYLTRDQYEAANNAVLCVAGYQRLTAEVSFGARTATMPMWNEDIYNTPADEPRTFYPLFTPEDALYTVSFQSGAQKERFDTRLQFSGNSGGYWTVNGDEWGQSETLTLFVFGDMEIENRMGSTTNYIALNKTAYMRDNTLAVFARLSLPSGAALTECGVLFQNGDYQKTDDYKNGLYLNLTLKTAPLKASMKPSGNDFMVMLDGVRRKHTRVGRAYAVYMLSGKTYTCYSKPQSFLMK